MEEQPLLIYNASERHKKPHKRKSSKLIRCTCARCIKLIELMVMGLQITVVILDWSSLCNRSLHSWMIVSLSYRPASFIFQWIFIEPCLRYLRRDKASSSRATDYDEAECCDNLLFCWIIPCLWLIDNDMFLLVWAILGTLLIIETNTNSDLATSVDTCSLDYIMSHAEAKLFYSTMIIVLVLSYIYWITTLFISLSLLCCPQLMNYCCFQLGYVVKRRKGENRLRDYHMAGMDGSDMSPMMSDMPGIRRTVSFSFSPSCNNKTPNTQTSVQTKVYIPTRKKAQNPYQPLPNHILKQFDRKLYKKDTLNPPLRRNIKARSPTPELVINNGDMHSNNKETNGTDPESKNEIELNIVSSNTPSFVDVLEDVATLSNLPSPRVLSKISPQDDDINTKIVSATSSFGASYCILCQHKYNENEILIVLTCNHQFHDLCSKQWFAQSSICPICNKNMCVL